MRILGVNQFSHDAALAVVEDGHILFGAHAERFSREKNDWVLNAEVLGEALSFGFPDVVAYFEKPFLKALRCKLFGGNYLRYERLPLDARTVTVSHHRSHAAGGFFLSPFSQATVVVLDAIGEFETCSVWFGDGDRLTRCFSDRFPFSFGLFYSAFTDALGLKANEEEYIVMGMAAYGDPSRYGDKVNALFPSISEQSISFHHSLDLTSLFGEDVDNFDLAAAVQMVYERRFREYVRFAVQLTGCKNLVLAGGCALNATANGKIFDLADAVFIGPNPGDAGSSLGAALSVYGGHAVSFSPFLGHNIPGDYPVEAIVRSLSQKGIAAVASGRAEFGPRALGNRSILANAHLRETRDLVNKYKGREEFRPFGCVVLEDDAKDWFDMPAMSPFMKFTFPCKQPNRIAAVVHEDGTSRVQTVNKQQYPGLFEVLTAWKKKTGVPVLLNTSLNVRGEPLVNSKEDIIKWNLTHRDLLILS